MSQGIETADIIKAIKETLSAKSEGGLSSAQLTLAIRKVVESLYGNIENLSPSALASAIQEAIVKMRESLPASNQSNGTEQNATNTAHDSAMITAGRGQAFAESFVTKLIEEAIKSGKDDRVIMKIIDAVTKDGTGSATHCSKEFLDKLLLLKTHIEEFHIRQSLEEQGKSETCTPLKFTKEQCERVMQAIKLDGLIQAFDIIHTHIIHLWNQKVQAFQLPPLQT